MRSARIPQTLSLANFTANSRKKTGFFPGLSYAFYVTDAHKKGLSGSNQRFAQKLQRIAQDVSWDLSLK